MKTPEEIDLEQWLDEQAGARLEMERLLDDMFPTPRFVIDGPRIKKVHKDSDRIQKYLVKERNA